MNEFDVVLSAVKKYCAGGALAGKDCFQSVSEIAHIPLDHLHFYLETLRNLGLIHYSISDKSIQLTSLGSTKEKLFA